METIEVTSGIWTGLKYQVPSTVEEYNALDPKRVQEGRNPCVEDAVSDILKHKVYGIFRRKSAEVVGKKYGIERRNKGTKESPQWETDGEFFNRLIVVVAQQRGLDATKPETEEVIASETFEDAQAVLSAVPFTVEYTPRTGGGPPAGKNDLKLAGEAWDQGKATTLAGLLSRKLGREVAVTADKEATVLAIAKALKDNRKVEADKIEAEQRALLAAS